MPKTFLSYSWTSPSHQDLIRSWADRLIADGIEVVIDVYDLKEGNDKYAFMEKMVTDASITHVLVFSDSQYAGKADGRQAGVGTESQIISREVYEKVSQSKFIPIACERQPSGEPYMPTFLRSRIWIDFSTPESVNDNWERLIRLLYGKPLNEKPRLGTPPVYIANEDAVPASSAAAKLATLRQAVLGAKPALYLYRRSFLDECLAFAEALRVRSRPTVDDLGKKVLEDCSKLKVVRHLLIDWLLLEGGATSDDSLRPDLLEFLEQLRGLKGRPPEINQWSDAWFEAHAVFVYETFLYIVAALLKSRRYELLADVYGNQYLIPESEGRGANRFETFHAFWASSDTLQSVLAPPGRRLFSPAAALVQRQADRTDLTFTNVKEADALSFLAAALRPDARWYPQTLLYMSYGSSLPFFARCAQKRQFRGLATILGVASGDALRAAYRAGTERLNVDRWDDIRSSVSLPECLNLAALDTI